MGYRHSKPDAIKRLQGTVLSNFFSPKIGNMARAKITSNRKPLRTYQVEFPRSLNGWESVTAELYVQVVFDI
jgi:hypothetical protein